MYKITISVDGSFSVVGNGYCLVDRRLEDSEIVDTAGLLIALFRVVEIIELHPNMVLRLRAVPDGMNELEGRLCIEGLTVREQLLSGRAFTFHCTHERVDECLYRLRVLALAG